MRRQRPHCEIIIRLREQKLSSLMNGLIRTYLSFILFIAAAVRVRPPSLTKRDCPFFFFLVGTIQQWIRPTRQPRDSISFCRNCPFLGVSNPEGRAREGLIDFQSSISVQYHLHKRPYRSSSLHCTQRPPAASKVRPSRPK